MLCRVLEPDHRACAASERTRSPKPMEFHIQLMLCRVLELDDRACAAFERTRSPKPMEFHVQLKLAGYILLHKDGLEVVV